MNNKKKGMTMWVKREEGKGVVFKFEAKNIPIHLFNLLALIYEVDLYDLWFPFCKKSKTVSHFVLKSLR